MRPAVDRRAFDARFELDSAQSAAVDVLTTRDRLGVYMWGPVGRGKTWLLDCYFDGVESAAKKRVHFHSFFRDVHASYFRQRFSIDRAIDEVLGDIELLCFDEFHVHDIGDGTLIARLLDTLFARRVTVVLTSNYSPDGLLPNPLFHDKFVPTIEVLKQHVRVVRIDGPVDYRSTAPERVGFAAGSWIDDSPIHGSPVHDTGWSFAELCSTPRSASDYLAMLEKNTQLQNCETLTITGIPRLKDTDVQSAQRFSNLVDILYDRGIRCDFHATVDRAEFGAGCEGLDIDRILSRLSQLRQREADLR